MRATPSPASCLLPLVLIVLTSCGDGNPPSPYPILDAGIITNIKSTAWLDDHVLLFVGTEYSILRDETKRERFNPPHALGIWDTATGDVRLYRRGVTGINCFDIGSKRIVYHSTDDGRDLRTGARPQFWHGTFGSEEPVGSQSYEPMTCERRGPAEGRPEYAGYPPSLIEPKDGHVPFVLKLPNGHGYLWTDDPLGTPDVKYTYTLFDAQGRRIRDLPTGLGRDFWQWQPYRNAYYFMRPETMTGDALVGWRLSADGGLDAVIAPSRVPVTGLGRSIRMDGTVVTPSPSGMVAEIGGFDEHAGLYLARAGAFEALTRGYVNLGGSRDQPLSPDGCRLAFTYEKDPTAIKDYRLQVMDLCEAIKRGAGKETAAGRPPG